MPWNISFNLPSFFTSFQILDGKALHRPPRWAHLLLSLLPNSPCLRGRIALQGTLHSSQHMPSVLNSSGTNEMYQRRKAVLKYSHVHEFFLEEGAKYILYIRPWFPCHSLIFFQFLVSDLWCLPVHGIRLEITS